MLPRKTVCHQGVKTFSSAALAVALDFAGGPTATARRRATARTSAAWAGAAPAPGMCWYYTDPSRTQGFWDYCP